jgi:VIT1/CCC1 family predicted Fe2+/Mn2+ transporter
VSRSPGAGASAQGPEPWRATLGRSARLFAAFRREQSDPEHFYTTLAQDTVAQLRTYTELAGRVVADIGGGPGYFAEALRTAGARCVSVESDAASDDGRLTGRGSPIKRGFASGIMTTIGGLGHALPYLIADFWTATTIAIIVVFVELWAIAYIQKRFMETPFWRAVMQVVLGGSLVFAAGILIGNA